MVNEDVNVQAKKKGNDFDVNNSLDPFELYLLLNKKKIVEEKMDKSNGTVSIPFPPGFTPCDETEVECDKKSMAEKVDNLEAVQKAKIKWAIEGDENTKFYHGILNKKCNQLGIRGVLKDGMWIDNPVVVKKEFLENFSTRFQQPRRIRPVINIDFPYTISELKKMNSKAIFHTKRLSGRCGIVGLINLRDRMELLSVSLEDIGL
nr:RNA-directed DNA polymerase, eukaryota [Tanacetum cinerariifolium]